MNTKKTTIVYASNDAYAYHALVSIYSILQFHSNEALSFVILESDIGIKKKRQIEKLFDHYPFANISFYTIDSSLFQSFKTSHYITLETYYRFFIAELFPDLSQCIYLDVDIVCYGDISELLSINLTKNEAVAGVHDAYVTSSNLPYLKEHHKNADEYINAGVLVLNLDYWRSQNSSNELLDYCSKFELKYDDQCAINFVFKNSIRLLPSKFNQMVSDNETSFLLRHFNGFSKPWNQLTKDRFYYQIRKNCWELLSGKRLNAFIYTLSDDIFYLEELLKNLPNVTIHVAAPTSCSQKLKALTKYSNLYIYEKCTEFEDIDFLLEESDFYLDINAGVEVDNILEFVQAKHLPIFAFEKFNHSVIRFEPKLAHSETDMINLIQAEFKRRYIDSQTVSIIVPIYNAQAHLEKCLESLVQQTYRNIEVILVNDASTDQSLRVCKAYANQYDEIRLINKYEHTGVADSRNIGIENSHGHYLTFVDSDDWIDPNFIEEHLSLMKKYSADIALSPHYSYVESDGVFQTYSSEFSTRMITIEDYFEQVMSDWFLLFLSSIGKVYSRTLFEGEGGFRFPFGSESEESYLIHRLFLKAHSILYIDKALYCWRNHSANLIHQAINEKKAQDLLSGYDQFFMDLVFSSQPMPSVNVYYKKQLIELKNKLEQADLSHSEVYKKISAKLTFS
ncbi:glycosyltransferase family 8 protein [Streptococcus cameli]